MKYNNKKFIMFFVFLVFGSIMNCAGHIDVTDDYILCTEFDDPIDCIIRNNERIPPFYARFSMLYLDINERQTLDGVAYIDPKNDRYSLTITIPGTGDVIAFKGTVVNNRVKMLFRTSTDNFEGIQGKLSKINLKNIANIDFDIDMVLKLLSLQTPILLEYDNIEYLENSTYNYILKKGDLEDRIIFLDELPQVGRFYRLLFENDNLSMVYEYRYRAYKKLDFNDKMFYIPQKTYLYYNPIKNNQPISEERVEIQVGINSIELYQNFDNSIFEFDFPENIIIHNINN